MKLYTYKFKPWTSGDKNPRYVYYIKENNRYLAIYNSTYSLEWMVENSCECTFLDNLPKKENNPNILDIKEDDPRSVDFIKNLLPKIIDSKQKQEDFYYERLEDTLSKMAVIEEKLKVLKNIDTEI